MSQETLIDFPADIAVKAMGLNQNDFETLVTQLLEPLLGSQVATVTTLSSKGGKYLSVSVRFTATNLEQLHAIYAALRNEPRVLYTL
ncbi:MAG: DUF493 domain-containing protein [Granulosicoccus sp.]|nr:DUF493 domain-containing protein [Granulosicoccus sp.]